VTTEDAGDATEADRALEVVRRKLTQTLSVEATVYDLINQARDEKNLALLFSGEFMIFFMFFFMFFLCVFADVSC
jgi:ataxia telangiectasia mutated family protein